MNEFNKTELLEKTTEYMNYIAQHKENIKKAWLELRDALNGIDLFQRPKILDEMEWRIRNHDDSKMSEEEFQDVIQTNLAGVFNGIKFVTRPMMKQRQGHIINMASVSGIIGNMGQANYSASKAGVIGLTKATAKELSSRGITVNAVAPGFIATEMTDKLSDAVKEEACKTIPLGAFGTVEDVAEAVVFLASDRAKYITGQVLCVDGGIAM